MIDLTADVITGSISGLATFLALFFANHLLDLKRYRETRPVLQVIAGENPSIAKINLPLFEISRSGLPTGIRQNSKFSLNYTVNRIKVRNIGNSAAEDCKGVIVQDGNEMNVCWNIPTERYKMTINAKSSEFLDLCAFLGDDPDEKAKELKKKVDSLPLQYTAPDNQNILLEEVSKIKYDYSDPYSEEDYKRIANDHFPYLIAPTENDWQKPPILNWRLKPGYAVIRITSKNASPIEHCIQILDKPVGDKIARSSSKGSIKRNPLKKKLMERYRRKTLRLDR